MFARFKQLSLTSSQASSWRVSRLWGRDSTHVVGLALLRLVAVAQQQHLNLASLVRCLALEHRGFIRRRLMRLTSLLEQGTPLVEAIEQQPHLLTDEQILELRFAHQSGTLGQRLPELIQRTSARSHESTHQVLQACTYGLGLVLAVGLILTFLSLFIYPTYTQIFEEFGLQRPYVLSSLMWWAYGLGRNLPLVALALAVLFTLWWFFRPLRSLQRWISLRITKSAIQLQHALLLRLLAHTLEAGRPLPGALSTLARYHFDRSTQIKLLFARNEVEQGSDVWHSLVSAKLLHEPEATALHSADTDAFRAWMMHKLAEEQEESVRLRSAILAMLVQPAIVLGIGCLVMWICVAYFSVLVTMISSLS